MVDADAGDRPLTEREIHRYCHEFRHVQLEKRHLLYMLKRLAKLPQGDWSEPLAPRPFWQAVKAIDQKVLRFRPLRRYCGEVIVFLKK
jgi:hypothetical protein